MTNELRAIADKANENKRREHAEAVKQYVEKHILPELKKRASAGYYGYTIECYGSYTVAEVLECWVSFGLTTVKLKAGNYRVAW